MSSDNNQFTDYRIRGTAADGQIRFLAATTRGVAEEARKRHNTSPVMTAALGRLMTAALLMASDMKGEKDLLTLQIRGDGPGKGLIVAADSFGNVKGYPIEPHVLIPANDKGKLDVSGALGAGTLSVIKDSGYAEPYSSQVKLVSGEIAEDVTYYYATSEQTPSAVALGVLMNKNNTVKQAGGYIIQLMPGTSDDVIDRLEPVLNNVTSVTTFLDDGMSPEDIINHLLKDFLPQISDEKHEVKFHCNCSKERTKKVLISLGKNELKDMVSETKPFEVHCHFCNTNYIFSSHEIEELIEEM
ncbi:MAG: Hsp33 family molecular chaperone HslO [Eubacterium sp.]|nr:Hsp33 family molecular chaperone HslO [Eubacterium sp.]